MTKPVKTFILIVGVLSFLSGIFLALNGSDFFEYVSAIFAGVALIGSVFFFEDKPGK